MQILLRKTSFLDYPGCISSVFFFPGCSLRCPWCHNRDLVLGLERNLIPFEQGLSFLRKRSSVLGGVVLSGGEPCLWDELPDLIAGIKRNLDGRGRSLSVKLDTNGMHPAMLEGLFSREETRPDYIALDFKIAPSRYRELLPENFGKSAVHCRDNASCKIDDAGKPIAANNCFDPGAALIQSAALIRESGIAHEYRTLALPQAPEAIAHSPSALPGGKINFIGEYDIEALAPLAMDSAPWIFRPFRAGTCLDPAWDALEERAGVAETQVLAQAKALAETARKLGKNGICGHTP